MQLSGNIKISILVLFLTIGHNALSFVSLNNDLKEIELHHLHFKKDNGETIEDILKLNSNQFKFEENSINEGLTSNSYWVYFDVVNLTNTSKWHIVISPSDLSQIDCYYQTNGKLTHNISGYNTKTENMLVKSAQNIIPIEFDKGKTTRIYLRIKDTDNLSCAVTMYSSAGIVEATFNQQLINSLIYGAFFIIGLYTLFVFFIFRDISFLFYSLFVFFLLMAVATMHGVFKGILFPEAPDLLVRVLPWEIVITSVFFILFLSKTFFIQTNYPKICKFFRIQILLNAFILISSIIYVPGPRLTIAILVSLVLLTSTSLLVVLLGIRDKQTSATFFLLGVIFKALGLGVYGAYLIGFKIHPDTALNALSLFFLVEISMFTLSLINRFYLIKKEKIRDVAKIIELKKERTNNQKILTSSFERFVPKQFLGMLGKENLTQIKLGDSINTNMTVLFLSIDAINKIGTSRNSKQVVEYLMELYDDLSPLIRKYNGFIDKFMGATVMALFKDPNDAVKASVEIQKTVEAFNKKLVMEGLPRIESSIGIHTGELMLGTVGEESRMEPTVVSDCVNIAARLRSTAIDYQARIFISHDTAQHISTEFNTRFLGQVILKGKSCPIGIVEVIDGDDLFSMETKMKTIHHFKKIEEALGQNHIQKALEIIQNNLEAFNYDAPVKTLFSRLQLQQSNPINKAI